ncbi:MAG: Rv2578c family radical SAM protein, partial [Acidimicrobiales bacterium]
MPLHLRPGVREHFLSWLAGARPELVEDYRRRYRRAYLPGREQDAVTSLVRKLVGAARKRHAPTGAAARRPAAAAHTHPMAVAPHSPPPSPPAPAH